MECQPPGNQPRHISFAAAFGSPRAPVTPLPVSAAFRAAATTAQRLLRHVSARLCAASVVQGDGSALARTATREGRAEPREYRSTSPRGNPCTVWEVMNALRASSGVAV